MVQSKKKPSLEQVLELAKQLNPEEQEKLYESLCEQQALRKALSVGIEQLKRGEGVPGEQVFENLFARHTLMVKESETE